jgi:hypothetical protein
MDSHQSKAQIVAVWLLPTAVEVTVYVLITALTLFLSSQDFIDKLLFATGNFNPIRYGVSWVDFLLRRVIGERFAGALSLAVFWGIIGLVVNLLWWLGSNFSTELNNNLIYSKYVHPKDVSPRAQLEDFIKRTVIRTTVAIVGLVYFNFVISSGLPKITDKFTLVTERWATKQDWLTLGLTILSELLMLHLIVVLTRLVLLRKKVFAD